MIAIANCFKMASITLFLINNYFLANFFHFLGVFLRMRFVAFMHAILTYKLGFLYHLDSKTSVFVPRSLVFPTAYILIHLYFTFYLLPLSLMFCKSCPCSYWHGNACTVPFRDISIKLSTLSFTDVYICIASFFLAKNSFIADLRLIVYPSVGG